jgi:hypothetical protein
MPTMKYMVNGERVPGTTTIIGRFKESGALLWWANQEGLAGRSIRGEDSAAQKAADIGTIAHAMMECDIKGKEFIKDDYPADLIPPAEKAFSAYCEWKNQTQLSMAESEMPLVSKKYRYGGTLDTILVKGVLSLGDFKTSNAIYMDYLLQLAAYRNLWEENFPDRLIVGGFHLLRFSKQGDFTHSWWGELDDAWEAFKLMRQLYDFDKKLKARL